MPWKEIKMKEFFKKTLNIISFPFAFIAFVVRLTIRGLGIIEEEEDEEEDNRN